MDTTGQDDAAILASLRTAVAGLLYPSETDAPFDVISSWPVKEGKPPRKVEEVAPDDFFGELRESDDAARFAQLRRALECNLSGVKVVRVGAGEPKVDVYLVGRSKSGATLGVHTTSVET